MVRVLISLPVENAIDAKELIDEIATVEGVEVIYGAN
jgi:hypothetical protein